jgi:hypothetical protein
VPLTSLDGAGSTRLVHFWRIGDAASLCFFAQRTGLFEHSYLIYACLYSIQPLGHEPGQSQ